MKNNIIFHTECDYKIKNPSIVSGWLIKSAKSESRVIGNINYIFCNDDYLLKKNQKYLQHDTLTDIITFDYSEENILNGDIYISVERIKENAVIFTVPFEEELNRVVPVLNNISKLKNKVPISLDTRKPEVMKKGLKKGVDIINDVSGLRYSRDTIPLLKKTKSPIIIMHSISTPKFMQVKINYKDVLIDIYDFLEKQITKCEKNNIDRSRIIIDPGIGFGKNLKQNLKLVKDISLFHSLGVSILLGASRKSFISKISKNALENERLGGSISSVLYALEQGVQIFRVHDVLETRQAIDVYNQIKSA